MLIAIRHAPKGFMPANTGQNITPQLAALAVASVAAVSLSGKAIRMQAIAEQDRARTLAEAISRASISVH
jgi:hypothetical protein